MRKFSKSWKLFTMLGLILAVTLALPGITLAADPACIDAAGAPVGCVMLAATPPELVGDVYVNGVLQTAALPLNHATLFFNAADTGIPQVIEIKNMTDGSDDMVKSKLYTYADFSKTVTPNPSSKPEIKVAPKKIYANGLLEVTCDAKKYIAENVTCSVTLDGVLDPDPLAPGAHFTYIVAPGTHQVNVSLTGTDAWLWPTPFSKSVTTKASGTPTKLKASFDKLAHVTFILKDTAALGKFTLDGLNITPVDASGSLQYTNSVDMWVTPNVSHKLKVEEVSTANDHYDTCWKDIAQTTKLASGAEKIIILTLRKTGCWFLPVIRWTAANYFSEGNYTITAQTSCADGTTYSPVTYALQVSNNAPLISDWVYLIISPGSLTKQPPGMEKPGDSLTSINPAQPMVFMEARNFGPNKPTDEQIQNLNCTSTLTIAGAPPLVMGSGWGLYQGKPQ
jgi:hypothetical protein